MGVKRKILSRDEFIAPARRALRRAARKALAENRRFGLPLIALKLKKGKASKTGVKRKYSTKAGRKRVKTPAFVLRAERAFRRAAKNVQAEHRVYKLPLILWEDGKLVKKPV
jgi:hypothetical protein